MATKRQSKPKTQQPKHEPEASRRNLTYENLGAAARGRMFGLGADGEPNEPPEDWFDNPLKLDAGGGPPPKKKR